MPDLSDKDKAAIKLVENDFDRYRKMREPFEARWSRYDRLYHMTEDKQKSVAGRANLVVVDAFEAVETIVPRMVGNRARFTLAARRRDNLRSAEVSTELCDYQQEQMDVDLKSQDVYRECAKFGTGISFLGWKQAVKKIEYEETSERPEQLVDGVVTGTFKQKKVLKKVIYDDPWEEYLSIWQVWTDPYVQNTDDQHSFVIVRVKRRSWAAGLVEDKVFSAKAEDLTGGNPESSDDAGHLRAQMENQGLLISFEDDPLDPFGVVYERWSKDRVITTWNNKVVLRDKPNPFAHGMVPLLNVVFTRVPGCWYGKGVIEPVEAQIQELTDHRNNLMDDANARAHTMWKRRRGSEIDDDQLISRPDGVIDVSNMTDIEVLQRGGADQSAYTLIQMLTGDIKRGAGLNDYALAQLPSKRVTPGEVATVAESAASRLDMPLTTYESMYVKRKGLMMYKMNQQFMTEEKTYRVTGKLDQIRSISPTDIQGDFDVIPIPGASRAVNRAFKRNEKIQLLNLLRAEPWFNAPKFTGDMLIADFDLQNGEEYIQGDVRPRQSEAEGALTAQAENVTFIRTGYISDPQTHEDHAIHNVTHAKVYESPHFADLPPEVQERFKMHVLKTDDMMKADTPEQQAPTAAPQLPPQGPGELPPPDEGLEPLPAAPAVGELA